MKNCFPSSPLFLARMAHLEPFDQSRSLIARLRKSSLAIQVEPEQHHTSPSEHENEAEGRPRSEAKTSSAGTAEDEKLGSPNLGSAYFNLDTPLGTPGTPLVLKRRQRRKSLIECERQKRVWMGGGICAVRFMGFEGRFQHKLKFLSLQNGEVSSVISWSGLWNHSEDQGRVSRSADETRKEGDITNYRGVVRSV